MQVTRLMKMNGLPSTEDLRYMLSTAKESRKLVELPFKHANGTSFCVKVIPPQAQFGPKWQFGKDDGSAAMWTRESADVMMIQNKIKIDSISTVSNAGPAAPVQDSNAIVFKPTITGNNIPAFTDPLQQNPFQGGAGQAGQASGSGYASMANLSSHGWMPQAKEPEQQLQKPTEKPMVALPPPVVLDPECTTQTLHALGNADTGLMDFAPFTYFLEREFHNFQKSGSKLSVVVFEFRDKDTFDSIDLPPQALEIVAKHLHAHCKNYEIPSRMETGEFVVLLAGSNSTEAMKFAETLWKELTEDFLTCFGEDPRSLAMGVSSIPEQCREPGFLLSTAQTAKEQARKAGHSHLLFSSL